MKIARIAALALLSSVALSGCGGTAVGPTAGASGTVAVSSSDARAATSDVLVTARLNKRPISGVAVTLTLKTWPNGKLIAQGKTRIHGSVKLSGDWTPQELICAGGKYTSSSGTREASVCQEPLAKRVILDFN
ncbi:MAG TPA: hypothetical protein VGX91_03675 [Candidatus Cybelea sp.]|nr:hypothetical protein [Candidatus Cybelea sp.]